MKDRFSVVWKSENELVEGRMLGVMSKSALERERPLLYLVLAAETRAR